MSNSCGAPVTAPQVVPRATLISLFLFLGPVAVRPPELSSRLPTVKGKWNCTNPYGQNVTRAANVNGARRKLLVGPECLPGAVLSKGYSQAVALGKAFKPYLVKTNITGKSYDRDRLQVNSSNSNGTVYSAVYFLHGAFPPRFEGKGVGISVDEEGPRPLEPAFLGDKHFKKILEEELNYGPDGIWFNSTSTLLNKKLLRKAYGRLSPLQLLNLGSTYLPYYCNNKTLPRKWTTELFDTLLLNSALLERRYAEFAPNQSVNPISEFVVHEIDAHLRSQSRSRFTIAASENIALVSFLFGLNYTELNAPLPPASYLAVEVWDNGTRYGRVVLNGKVIPIEGRQLVEFELFQAVLDTSDPRKAHLTKLRYSLEGIKAELERKKAGTKSDVEDVERRQGAGKKKSSRSGRSGSSPAASDDTDEGDDDSVGAGGSEERDSEEDTDLDEGVKDASSDGSVDEPSESGLNSEHESSS